METVLQIHSIEKSYGPVKALKGVSFKVPKGSVFGVLGPNGSGKTTMLGILLDVLKADAGTYHWENYQHAAAARKKIGSLLETPNFYHYMTAYDNLEITATIKERGLDDIDNVLKKVNLFERRHTKFSTFSLGMKQRLAIAGALLGNPDILVLDEPTNGLDPVGIAEIRELIIQLSREGITIIMASHLLDEVEKVCTDVAILKQGNLLSAGPVIEVLNDDDWIEVGCSDNEALAALLRRHIGLKNIIVHTYVQVSFGSEMDTEALNKYCFENGFILHHIQKRKRSLESKFMEMTK
jgi:ABC-2 type transport system ATP-binding protein